MMEKNLINRNNLIGELQKGICKVVFRKVTNGAFRSIYCTLNNKILPGSQFKSLKTALSSSNNELLSIYDIKEKSWKSFYIPTVRYFYTTLDLKDDRFVRNLLKSNQRNST